MTSWTEAFPPLTKDEARELFVKDICEEADFLRAALDDLCDTPADMLKLSVEDVLTAFHGNCWDDQGDGGTHKKDLRDVNRLFMFFERPERCDDYTKWENLPDDELQEVDPDAWWEKNI